MRKTKESTKNELERRSYAETDVLIFRAERQEDGPDTKSVKESEKGVRKTGASEKRDSESKIIVIRRSPGEKNSEVRAHESACLLRGARNAINKRKAGRERRLRKEEKNRQKVS